MAHDLLRLYLNDTATPPAITDDQLTEVLGKVDNDFNAAVAEGWRIKAAKVADWYDASLDGSSLSRDQVFEHCLAMAELYEAKGGGTMSNVGLEGPSHPATDGDDFV